MNIPEDYILNAIQKRFEERIDILERNVIRDIAEIKNEIKESNKQIKEISQYCERRMESHNKRLRTFEDFRLQIVTISGLIGGLSALLISILLNI